MLWSGLFLANIASLKVIDPGTGIAERISSESSTESQCETDLNRLIA
jgi:hypothetical protein